MLNNFCDMYFKFFAQGKWFFVNFCVILGQFLSQLNNFHFVLNNFHGVFKKFCYFMLCTVDSKSGEKVMIQDVSNFNGTYKSSEFCPNFIKK